MLLVFVLIFPSVGWSEIGDSYQCQDETGELGGEGTDENFSFVFKWNSKEIKINFYDYEEVSKHKILFQNRYEFISSESDPKGTGGRVTWTFNDIEGKGFLLRSFLSGNYHYVKKSVCFKVVL